MSGPRPVPARPYPPPLAARTNGMAIGAVVAGILFFTWIGAVLAVVFGHLARRQIRRAGGWERGDGLAVAGLVLGYAGLAVLVCTLLSVATGRVD